MLLLDEERVFELQVKFQMEDLILRSAARKVFRTMFLSAIVSTVSATFVSVRMNANGRRNVRQ